NFSFYGLQPGKPTASLMYSWKLEGFDAGWSTPSTQKEVSYANLPPGNYNFLVRAGTKNGLWSSVESAQINIGAPWWLSTPAYLLYALLFILILALPFFLYKLGTMRRNKAEGSGLNKDIGAPLNTLLASIDNLSNEIDQKKKQRLRNIVVRLRELLEPVLKLQPALSNLSRPPKIESIVVRDYMNEMLKEMSSLLKEKDLEMIINDQFSLKYFYYDLVLLNRILMTTISNSIKYYLEKGKIIVNIIQTNRGDLKIQIADNGSGIPM